MPIYAKESLEALRQRVDLAEVLNSHIDLKKTGASYKGLCPFHDEKTPSFVIQKGDTHYHCFGCGAHGDALQFLMTHLKMPFSAAVESLAERFQVHLELVEGSSEVKGPNKADLKSALDYAAKFFQFTLLHTSDGHEALKYLYSRGIDLEFIYRFGIGLAPREPLALRKLLNSKYVKDEVIAEAGLIVEGKNGKWRDFFLDRITFPIGDQTGAIIGFSARKYKDDTYGGKYINTSETALFKKSKVLFGLHHSRRRIAKERVAIIVEGQIDALRLINAGLNITVASQGTAFGDGHLKELMALGVNRIYLALDSDEAGKKAAHKIGDMFQKVGVEVQVVQLVEGEDPDSYLRSYGIEAFLKLINTSVDYLTFLVDFYSKQFNTNSPAGKNELVQTLVTQIRAWDKPLMVYESLRKIAKLADVPEEMLGVTQENMPTPYSSNVYVKKTGSIGIQTVDPDKILESDVLRWLIFGLKQYPHFVKLAELNLLAASFQVEGCRHVYEAWHKIVLAGKPCDLLMLASEVCDMSAQDVISGLLEKKVNFDRAEECFKESLQKILDRNWMQQTESIKAKIQSANCSEDEVLFLVKKFDDLKKSPPKIKS